MYVRNTLESKATRQATKPGRSGEGVERVQDLNADHDVSPQ